MITNSKITIYHMSGLNKDHLEKWDRYIYEGWFYGGKGAGLNQGFENANDVQVRIPYDKNIELDFGNFSIGDIVVQGTLDLDIETQQDLKDYQTYNITSLNNNNFGINKHIHIGGQ